LAQAFDFHRSSELISFCLIPAQAIGILPAVGNVAFWPSPVRNAAFSHYARLANGLGVVKSVKSVKMSSRIIS